LAFQSNIFLKTRKRRERERINSTRALAASVIKNCFIIFELKHSGGVPNGQGAALAKLADAIQAGGKDCAVFVAIHNTPYPETIVAKDAIVQSVYYDGKWLKERKNRTLYQIALNFIDYIKKRER
jgi:hypothetical protein